jgi:hypothetical protein
MAAWRVITGSGLDDWIYWHLLVQSLLITIIYKNSQSIFCRGFAPFSFSFCLNSTTGYSLSYTPFYAVYSHSLASPSSTTILLQPLNSQFQFFNTSLSLSLILRPTVSRRVYLGIKQPSEAYDQIFITVSCGFVDVGRSLWREDESVVYNCSWAPAQSFSGPSPMGLVTIFYCLGFETSIFVASYDSQGYGGGIRPHLHTGLIPSYKPTLAI